MFDAFSYVVLGIAIIGAAIVPLVPKSGLRKKVVSVSLGCAAIALFLPAVSLYLWLVVGAGLLISACVAIVRRFKDMRC